MKYYLQVSKGPRLPEPVLLKGKKSIGRGSDSDIVIIEEGISRKHLLIEVKGDSVFLTDLQSANGTKIGDEKLSPNKPYEFVTFFMPITLGKKVELTIEQKPF